MSVNQWELGPEIYHFRYKEADTNTKINGPMYGLAGSFTHHNPNHMMFKMDGHTNWGEMEYSSTDVGRMTGVDDYTLEIRAVGGYEIQSNDDWILTPFLGAGYRYLSENSFGRSSSGGVAGRQLEFNYFYSPLGVELTTQIDDNWKLGFCVEYDIFWNGEQKDHREELDPSTDTTLYEQNRGYGVRGSIKLQKKGEEYDILIEPFIRWWSIKESQDTDIISGGVVIDNDFLAKNNTLELGGKISAIF